MNRIAYGIQSERLYRPGKPAASEPQQVEEWRDVVGFEGFYRVSDSGRVKRVDSGRIISPAIDRHSQRNDRPGYLIVHLYRPGRLPKTVRVHKLVYAAFHGPVPAGKIVNHNDGNKSNNTPGNLSPATYLENSHHAIQTKLIDQNGTKNKMAKLTEESVAKIRAFHRSGRLGYIKIARLFGISSGTVRGIIKGTKWVGVQATLEAIDIPEIPKRPERPIDPIRSVKYLDWIRSLACVVCERQGPSEASHTGPHGLSVKSSDFSSIPLCHLHHRTGSDAYHKIGRGSFESVHGLVITDIVLDLNSRYIAIEKANTAKCLMPCSMERGTDGRY